ncbi:glycerol uptake operon antiterminator [Gracilibacillus ureilyticus]|uniref:Glycerol uptake operon antiterminator regulatory protein n=1 Tax=Gracilibacillus ureilyticus TaxID=531814 RepID=A0A1H9PNI7_9BACI|nr:glycerol-3-phosphate responsive antiterminator [Gracilibacillus ureilyticus]SER49738.1 glycerol uptake operon antiterminator [Gracilibacillus ureilyticus]
MQLKGVLPAIRNMKDFEEIVKSEHNLFILLETRIAQLNQMVRYAKKYGKTVFVHADLINGLKVDQYGMEYLIRQVKVDGIISTRNNVVSLAKKHKIVAIQRLFALDSLAVQNNIKMIKQSKPDYIEVLPGIIPEVIEEVSRETETPVIAGGLIKTKKQIQEAFDSGAVAITTSSKVLW